VENSGEHLIPEHPAPIEPSGRSYDRWITGIIGAGLVSLLAFLAARDRVSVDAQFGRVDSAVSVLQQHDADQQAQLAVLKSKQDRVLEDLAENSRKLDIILIEMRKR
jgi:hypothetical protein